MHCFLHLADLHIDSPMVGLERYEGAPVDRLRSSTRRAFTNAIDLALDERVDFVVIPGDLYDRDWRDFHTGLFFVAEMRRLEEAGIRVFIALGNHDAANRITKTLRLPENVTVLSTHSPERIVLDELGVAIHGQSYAKGAVTEDLVAGYPAPVPGLLNVGLLHTAIDGRFGHHTYAPTTVDALRGCGYQYFALGHIHTPTEVSRDPWIVFPGNLQGRHVQESGPRGGVLVRYEGDQVVSVERRALDVVRWELIEVDATDDRCAEEVVDRARGALEEAQAAAEGRLLAARVRVIGATRAHAELVCDSLRWVAEVRAAAPRHSVWIEQVQIDTRPYVSLAELRGRNDAVGDVLGSLEQAAASEDLSDALQAELAPLVKKLGQAGCQISGPLTSEEVETATARLTARLLEECS